MDRRRFLAASAASLTAACSRAAAPRYLGHAFIANQAGRAIAVVDLRAFALIRHIPLTHAPHLVITHPAHGVLFAAAEDRLIAIDADKLEPTHNIKLPAPATEFAFSADGATLYALSPQSQSILAIDPAAVAIRHRITLAAEPARFTFSRDGAFAAASLPNKAALAVVDLAQAKLAATVPVGGKPHTIRFRSDGRYLITGDRANHTAVLVDTAAASSPRLAVRLPLGMEPLQLREKSDGGQIFFTGLGLDAVVTLYPYRTEIGSTALAGHAPGAMALSEAPPYLFVANTSAATVTILNLATQTVVAAVGVGRDPIHISVTPDNEYALVLNHTSGDMSVLHIPTLAGGRTKSAALLTQIPVGSAPLSAAIRLS